MIGIDELTGLAGWRPGGLVWDQDVWVRLVNTLLTADPLGSGVVIVMTVAEQTVAQRT
jgi:hypothetical protein